MQSITIICPLYEAESYILSLNKSLLKQKKVNIEKIKYILTESNDKTEKLLIKNNLEYEKIKKKNFSHSLSREKAAFDSNSNIVVFITQDIEIKDDLWLYYLTKDIIENKVQAAYSRQISKYKTIEKYTREKNYPKSSKIKSKKDLKQLGLNTFFFSNASSAIKLDIFKELNGYDKKNLPINEDMYFAYKLIMNNYKIKYEAKSIVYHSHQFSLKQLYKRYYLTGLFFKENDYFKNYQINTSGIKLAKYVLKRIVEEKNIKAFIRFIPDMVVRFVAMKKAIR